MLHPKNDRIDYGEQLIPPPGYEFARAIGTSYSLDLEALMVLPVALFYSQPLDGDVEQLRYDMLEAITRSSEKITVYYQKGQLKAPKKYHHLMAYWERGIEPITMPSYLNSFHPKVWVIRYDSKDGPAKYRLLVTSRNLTFCRDWDVAFSTEGEVTDTLQTQNEPLIHFLNYLNTKGSREISPLFLNDLMKVKFDVPNGFDSMAFSPIGIENPEQGKPYINPLTLKKIWDELLIVSPFVDHTTLQKLSEITKEAPYLLCRKEELDSIKEQQLRKFEAWQFSNYIQGAEHRNFLEDDGIIPLDQNLHAKLYIGMSQKTAHWFLGSANCSEPALERNVEFMVSLKSIGSKFGAEEIYCNLTDAEKRDTIPLFEKYNYEARQNVDAQKQTELEVRKIRYDVSQLPMKGYLEALEGGQAYSLKLVIDAQELNLPVGFNVKMKPLPENQKSLYTLKPGEVNTVTDFTGYTETALSPFLLFEIRQVGLMCARFLIRMDIELPESRLNKIFTAIIDSQEKFFKYLSFLLSGDDAEMISGSSATEQQGRRLNTNDAYLDLEKAPVYEKLLVAVSRHPEKLKSIDALIQKLKTESEQQQKPIVTAEFESFWQIFQTFIQHQQ